MILPNTSTSTDTLLLVASLALVISTGPGWAQDVSVENGVRFPDGTVQMTSARPTPTTVRETGMKACFDDLGVEVACAGTGHDGDGRPGMEWSAGRRFVQFGTGIVIDTLTGLMWLRDAGCIASSTWEDAFAAVTSFNGGAEFGCLEYTAGSFDDWRVPSVTELVSLIDYGDTFAVPAGHPFVALAVGNCSIWTSTTQINLQGDRDRAWGARLGSAIAPHLLTGQIKNNSNNCVLPVRTQVGAPPPDDAVLALTGGGITFGDGSLQSSAPLPGFLLIPETGQTDCFSDSGIPIQCAGSGQDGETQNGVPWPDPRLVDNGDGTVKDELTGLTWLKDAECLGEFVQWEEALGKLDDLSTGTDFSCIDYTPGSFDDWRLPTITEQLSLFDFGSDTGLPSGHPFDFSDITLCQVFWSSTTLVTDAEFAWRLRVGPKATTGFDVNATDKAGNGCVWPVRE